MADDDLKFQQYHGGAVPFAANHPDVCNALDDVPKRQGYLFAVSDKCKPGWQD